LLFEARLQGASLFLARLQGAALDNALLQGVILYGAQLQGASLVNAKLQGVWLANAELQGAALDGAWLEGASLDDAWLQGASFVEAQLQGASLDNVKLQGANFYGSTFAGTKLRDAAVWRTNFAAASLTAVYEDGVKESALTKDEFATLNAMIMNDVPDAEQRKQAVKRIEKLNPDILGPEARTRDTRRGGATAYWKVLADQLKSLACSGDESAPYIVRGLVNNGGIKYASAQAPGLVEAILKPDCPVSAALTEADKAALEKLKKEASGAH
jgi:hypothetical protein